MTLSMGGRYAAGQRASLFAFNWSRTFRHAGRLLWEFLRFSTIASRDSPDADAEWEACQYQILNSLLGFFFTMACKQNLDLRCVLISDPSTLDAGAQTRLKSRIKKFTPHCVCRLKGIDEGGTAGTPTPLWHTTSSVLTTFPICYAICMRNHRIIIGNVAARAAQQVTQPP